MYPFFVIRRVNYLKRIRIPKLVIIVPAVIGICFFIYFILNLIFSPYWDSVYAPTGYFSMATMRQASPSDTVYTKQQACDDLDYLVKYLSRVHPDYIDGIPAEIEELHKEKKNSFADEVSSLELWRAAAEIVSAVGDPETLVMPSFEQNYLVDYINKINLGYTPMSVDGKKIEDILHDNSKYLSFGSEEQGIALIKALIQSKEGYKFLNMDSTGHKIVYVAANGTKETVSYSETDFYPYSEAVNMIEYKTEEAYTYEINKKNNYGLITINSCDYDSDFKKFVYEFFGEVADKNIGNVIIDLSDASAGSSQVADEIIMYLSVDKVNIPGGVYRMGPYLMKWDTESQQINHYDDLLYNGRVYLIISEKTLSSAVMAAEMFADNGLAVSVGEPCGSMPACCGDVAVFQTPNAALSFQVSTKRFARIDESKTDLPLEPDVFCDRSEALSKICEIIKNK